MFSLATMRKIREEGAEFRSHLDGAKHLLTPEAATEVQAQLGSDIAMVLDECIATPATREAAREAMERSVRWARRARARFEQLRADSTARTRCSVTNPGQAQFGIVQGATFADLRTESVQATVEIGFEAYAIGGLSVGEPPEVMYEVVGHTAPLLPEDRPRYLMGTGHAGRPLRVRRARHRHVRLRAADPERPERPVPDQPWSSVHQERAVRRGPRARPIRAARCYTCRTFSRAYLRHLYMSGEMTAATLNSLHNLHFYLDTMRRIREALVFGTFEKLRLEFHQTFSRRPRH